MEPDHSAYIVEFIKKYPKTILVSSQKSFNMMKNYYHNEYESNRIIVKDGSTINLGKRIFTFINLEVIISMKIGKVKQEGIL